MKQNISSSQLNELSDKGKEKLRKWWKPEQGDRVYDSELKGGPKWIAILALAQSPEKDLLPLLSIGQMIEFLGDRLVEEFEEAQINVNEEGGKRYWCVLNSEADELSDALWEACKEVLK